MARSAYLVWLLGVSAVTVSGQDWPHWCGPNRDGTIAASAVPKAWPSAVTRAWRVDVGEGHSSPVIAASRVIVRSRRAPEERVTAVDPGWLVWQGPTASRLAVPGGEIVYDVAGSGDAVVFLHGAFMDRGSWDAQVPAFAQQYQVVRYDIRPFGESTTTQPYSTHDDLLRLLEHLRIARAHLVGHSFGGGVAIDFALAHPDRVASLTLAGAGPMGFVAPEEERKAAGAIFAVVKQGDDAILAAWLKHPMWSASQQRPDVLKALDASTRKSLSAFRLPFPPFVPMKPSAVERLGEIKAPTLVIVGDRDTPGNRQASDLLAKQIRTARLQMMAGADHALPLGWSAEFNSAVLAFLATARR